MRSNGYEYHEMVEKNEEIQKSKDVLDSAINAERNKRIAKIILAILVTLAAVAVLTLSILGIIPTHPAILAGAGAVIAAGIASVTNDSVNINDLNKKELGGFKEISELSKVVEEKVKAYEAEFGSKPLNPEQIKEIKATATYQTPPENQQQKKPKRRMPIFNHSKKNHEPYDEMSTTSTSNISELYNMQPRKKMGAQSIDFGSMIQGLSDLFEQGKGK